jgi:hypothetical protein
MVARKAPPPGCFLTRGRGCCQVPPLSRALNRGLPTANPRSAEERQAWLPMPWAPSPLRRSILVLPEPSRSGRATGGIEPGSSPPARRRRGDGRSQWGDWRTERGKWMGGSRSRRVDRVGADRCVGPTTWIISRIGLGGSSAQQKHSRLV